MALLAEMTEPRRVVSAAPMKEPRRGEFDAEPTPSEKVAELGREPP